MHKDLLPGTSGATSKGKSNPFGSSDDSPSPRGSRYPTRSSTRRTGATDDSDEDVQMHTADDISPFHGLDASFMDRNYMNLTAFEPGYNVSCIFSRRLYILCSRMQYILHI